MAVNCAFGYCAPSTASLQALVLMRHRQREDSQAHRQMPTRYTNSHARQIRPERDRLRRLLTERTMRASRGVHSGQPAKIAPFEWDTAEAKRSGRGHSAGQFQLRAPLDTAALCRARKRSRTARPGDRKLIKAAVLRRRRKPQGHSRRPRGAPPTDQGPLASRRDRCVRRRISALRAVFQGCLNYPR